MSERTRLRNRRAAESFAFRCGGMRYVATVVVVRRWAAG